MRASKLRVHGFSLSTTRLYTKTARTWNIRKANSACGTFYRNPCKKKTWPVGETGHVFFLHEFYFRPRLLSLRYPHRLRANLRRWRATRIGPATAFQTTDGAHVHIAVHLNLAGETHAAQSPLGQFVLLGLRSSLRLRFICHCYREGSHTIRIISARKATSGETNFYP